MPQPAESRGWGPDLSGQVAIVTGASRGIGRQVAQALAGAGARVACVARSAENLAETVRAIRDLGGTAEPFPCNVADNQSVVETVKLVVERLDGLQILVNNAGVTRDGLVPRMPDEDWDEVLNTNLRGAFYFIRAAARPLMQGRYGRIVNVASISGIMGNAGQANYSASKAGLIGLTRSVAKELAGRNVTVNAIAPGFIATEMTAALGPGLEEEIKKRVPLKRLGTADEVAEAVLFLVGRGAGYITGQVLVVDGGLTA